MRRNNHYDMFHDEAAHETARRFEIVLAVSAVILALHTLIYHFAL